VVVVTLGRRAWRGRRAGGQCYDFKIFSPIFLLFYHFSTVVYKMTKYALIVWSKEK
jgi:hypothetical protein